jgi:ATP-dependent DNA helicase RecG
MPAGRKKVITEIVLAAQREEMYEKVKMQIKEGRQVYVICPRIDEPDEDSQKKLQLKSVLSEAARLKKDIFKKEKIDVLHGKMKSDEKDRIMKKWSAGDIDILVATSVVEVGVSVANATVIIIEGAERFGLSQLHQLRGRVIRGTHQPYAYAVTENSSEKTQERLRRFVEAKNGFELAEMDLELRGSGGLTEGKQWGVSDIAMAALKNIKLVEAARESAKEVLKKDLTLSLFPTLQKKMEERKKTHLE